MITTETQTTNETRAESSRTGRLQDLYTRHAPAGMRLAYFLTGDRELAGDLVQDAFVKVVGRFGHLRVPDAFDAYLRRTIVNLFRRTFAVCGSSDARSSSSARPACRSNGTATSPSATRCGLRCRRCRSGNAPLWCSATTRTCPSARPPRCSAAPSGPPSSS